MVTMTAVLKAYSYVRISSGRQKDGDGVRRQLDLSRRYADANGLDLDDSLRDLGISAFDGSNRERGALSRFLMREGIYSRGYVGLFAG